MASAKASSGGRMSRREFKRLAAGKFKKGDYIQDREMRFASGRITGRGIVGRGRGALEAYRVQGPRGEMIIPVRSARALGIYA